MTDGPKPSQPVVSSYLDEVEVELDAVDRLAEPPMNRLAAFHLEQAVEKLVKAVRLHRGLVATKDHNIEALLAELDRSDPWLPRLEPFEWTSTFATTYRYPSPTGKRKPGPERAELLEAAKQVRALLQLARRDLVVT